MVKVHAKHGFFGDVQRVMLVVRRSIAHRFARDAVVVKDGLALAPLRFLPRLNLRKDGRRKTDKKNVSSSTVCAPHINTPKKMKLLNISIALQSSFDSNY